MDSTGGKEHDRAVGLQSTAPRCHPQTSPHSGLQSLTWLRPWSVCAWRGRRRRRRRVLRSPHPSRSEHRWRSPAPPLRGGRSTTVWRHAVRHRVLEKLPCRAVHRSGRSQWTRPMPRMPSKKGADRDGTLPRASRPHHRRVRVARRRTRALQHHARKACARWHTHHRRCCQDRTRRAREAAAWGASAARRERTPPMHGPSAQAMGSPTACCTGGRTLPPDCA